MGVPGAGVGVSVQQCGCRYSARGWAALARGWRRCAGAPAGRAHWQPCRRGCAPAAAAAGAGGARAKAASKGGGKGGSKAVSGSASRGRGAAATVEQGVSAPPSMVTRIARPKLSAARRAGSYRTVCGSEQEEAAEQAKPVPAWLVGRLEDLRREHAELEAAQRDNRLTAGEGDRQDWQEQQARAPAGLLGARMRPRGRAHSRPVWCSAVLCHAASKARAGIDNVCYVPEQGWTCRSSAQPRMHFVCCDS